MPSFHYEALKISDRSKVSGVINAGDEKEARELLRDQELLPTKLKVVNNDMATAKGKRLNPIQEILQQFMGVGSKEKLTFTRNIGMMIRAGIPLTEALMYFENYVTNRKFRKVVQQIRADILSGYSLSQALAKHKKIFNDVYVTVTQAGERSGELDQTMSRLTDLMVKSEKVKMKVISASIYPLIVLLIVCLVLIVMFVLVIPTFVDIYDQMGVALPAITQFMFMLSEMLRNHWYIAFPMMGFSIFGLIKYFTTAGGKSLWDRMVLMIPVFGDLVTHIQNSHFISTFFVAFSSGLPITEAIYLSAQTVQHTHIRAAFQQVNIQIQTGQRLAVALSSTGYVPDIVLLMISSGEESGDLERMLENSFDYLEDEISHRIDILTSMMEPAMLVVVGVVVGFVAMSIYLPLFSIYEFI